MALRARSWVLGLTILSRVINATPVLPIDHTQVEQAYVDPDAEIDRAYQEKTQHESKHQHSNPDESLKYQVHKVHHNQGHHSTAEQKLRSVLRQSAATDINAPINPDLNHHTEQQHPNNLLSDDSKSTKEDDQSKPKIHQDLDELYVHIPDAIPQDDHISDDTPPVREDVDQNPQTHDEDDSEIEIKRQESEVEGGHKDPSNELSLDDTSEEEMKSEVDDGHGEREYPSALRLHQKEAPETNSITSISDVYFMAVVVGCAVAGMAGLLMAGVCWYRLHKKIEATSDVEYPAYGVTGPTKEKVGSPGDRKLAQSAQMYHYQHQKQQMIASERLNSDVHHGGSDVESEEENEEGDYTVFECPGLATTGEMEVRNPLFNEQTPVAPPGSGDLDCQSRK